MTHIPNVLFRLSSSLKHSRTPQLTRLELLMAKQTPTEGTLVQLVTAGLLYASAWWSVTGNEGAPIECMPNDLMEQSVRNPLLADWLEEVAHEGAPVLLEALNLQDVGVTAHAAQNSLFHIFDLARAIGEPGAHAITLTRRIFKDHIAAPRMRMTV